MNAWTWAWLLIGGVALVASLTGHAAQLALEQARALGDTPAPYQHAAQAPMGQLAGVMLALAVSMIAGRFVAGARSHRSDSDWLLPALAVVRGFGAVRLAATVLALQLASLVCGELIEQHLSAYRQPGVGAVFGSGHATAPFVHFVVGLALSILLRSFARCACEHVAQMAHAVRLIALPPGGACATGAAALRRLLLRFFTLGPPVLARRIANRPPPAWASFSA